MTDDLWTAATRHPFLHAVGDGTIAATAFNTWLVQDALFVADLLTFQARLLARAPRPAQSTLAGGCAALVSELHWFDEQAAIRGIDMDQPAQPATLAYRELLNRLDDAPYESAVTALWVIERVYLLAWTTATTSPGADSSPYREFVAHWTDPGFATYVEDLGALAVEAGHDDIISEVLKLEIAFWDMALTGE